ncbi:apolipoprotein N-acyltransferase [Pelagibius sp. Alg239-R121]|uniref:apolipoprotein N-acyltransferase n=1 Tax=Pelagibius sp. Alg239-R121 TaxID=2993448 RepID=UPI0024A6BA17|nr:apolipoprotein N-acyltransferase [Pelagibius sp. Alg239-R121]
MSETFLGRCAGFLAALTGWRRHAAAAVCGALGAAALPPVYLIPLLIPAFCGLLWLLDGVGRPRQALFLGWSFGFGHGLVGLYWVGYAFLVDAAQFGFLMPFAVAGLAALLAVFQALAIYAVAQLSWRGVARGVALAVFWVLSEWLRSWIFTGFPWNLMGSVWTFSPEMLQLAALTGVWGLSFLTLLAASVPAALAGGDEPKIRVRLVVGLFFLLPALAWTGGAVRLASAPIPETHVVEGVTLRLVQPNVEQSRKWQRDLRRGHLDDLIRLSRSPGFEAVTHVIWPETAIPYLISNDSRDADLRSLVAAASPANGLLLTGAPRAGDGRSGSTERSVGGGRLTWNSLIALDATGTARETYDKFHLVPFGEYVPLRWLLSFSKLTAGRGDFSSGPGMTTLSFPGLPPVSPLICYEIIFPGQVVDPDHRPSWMLNVTNDAWFGDSSGPRQHFATARMRAVEEGIPVIRVANTGISGVIDGYGRVLGEMALGTEGILDIALPKPVDDQKIVSISSGWKLITQLFLFIVIGFGLRNFS